MFFVTGRHPVPVELTSFSATATENSVKLSWMTATESNNFGFQVERKNESAWQKIAFLQGKGTTTIPTNYHYTDENLQPGTYQYRLKQIDTDGAFEYSNILSVTVGAPERFSLQQNYPNPFNPSTSINYELLTDGKVVLKIYNLLGQKVRTLVNGNQAAGFRSVLWDGKNDSGSSVPSGIYIYEMRAGDFIMRRKAMFLK